MAINPRVRAIDQDRILVDVAAPDATISTSPLGGHMLLYLDLPQARVLHRQLGELLEQQ